MKRKLMAAILTGIMVGSSLIPATTVLAGDDVETLRVWVFGEGSTAECEAVSKALSEITREKIGVNVEIVETIDTEKLNLAMTSGEKLDLVCAHNLDQIGLVNSGMILPLDELYTTYAADAASMIAEDDLKSLYYNGEMYFLPNNADKARASGVVMRKDILDEIGVDADSITDMDSLHDVLVKVKEAHPELSPLVPSWIGGGMQKTFHIDDIYNGLVVLENGFDSSDTTITSQYETQEWKDFCKHMYEWNQEGLLLPDASTSTDNAPMKTVGFADFENLTPTKISDCENTWGHEFVYAQFVEPLKDTERNKGRWCIPAGCEDPEKAMELWNLMYTDKDVATLCAYGIEGVNYEWVEEGSVFRALDGDTYTSYDWAWPNQNILPVFEGTDPAVRQELEDFNNNSTPATSLGFILDTSSIMNEITACNNVKQKYETPLQWGALDPDEAIPEFIAELEAAGIRTIHEEAQRQLDEYLANQK